MPPTIAMKTVAAKTSQSDIRRLWVPERSQATRRRASRRPPRFRRPAASAPVRGARIGMGQGAARQPRPQQQQQDEARRRGRDKDDPADRAQPCERCVMSPRSATVPAGRAGAHRARRSRAGSGRWNIARSPIGARLGRAQPSPDDGRGRKRVRQRFGLSGGTSRPVLPGRATSRQPGTSVATSGRPRRRLPIGSSGFPLRRVRGERRYALVATRYTRHRHGRAGPGSEFCAMPRAMRPGSRSGSAVRARQQAIGKWRCRAGSGSHERAPASARPCRRAAGRQTPL